LKKISQEKYESRLTSNLEGFNQVKIMKVPFLRGRSKKTLRKMLKAISSAVVDAGILGDMASLNASQNVLP